MSMGSTTNERAGQKDVQARTCTDPIVGAILSGWRYDISSISPEMRTDYEHHLDECLHCRKRQHHARFIDVLLISAFSLSIAAFLLLALVLRRFEQAAHIPAILRLHIHQMPVMISLEVVALAGLVVSTVLWVLVAIATPLPGLVGEVVRERVPADLRERFTRRHAA